MFPVLATRRNLLNDRSGIDSDFGRLLNNWWGDTDRMMWSTNYPVDIWEDDDYVYAEAELPGFSRDQIDVTIEQGVLHISAERKIEDTDKQPAYHLRERGYRRYHRSFTLPTHVSDEKAEATFENGVLMLKLPKTPEVKPRRISVK